MEGYELKLSAGEALFLHYELNRAASYHRSVAEQHKELVKPGFNGHLRIAEWHEDKANRCDELAYRVSLILGD